MRTAIRVDASSSIGTGHAMRCLTLAAILREGGADVVFICRRQPGDLSDVIEARGFAVARLSTSAPGEPSSDTFWRTDAAQSRDIIESLGSKLDLLVVDHYGIGIEWERALRPYVRRILAIDDLADRAHDCDLLLDQNLHDMPTSRYDSLVPSRARVFVGPHYALLRAEFAQAVPSVRNHGLRRMLVFFGGGDRTSEVLNVVRALHSLGDQAPQTTLVLGRTDAYPEEISRIAQQVKGLELVKVTQNMATLVQGADLAIGTCGGSAWERCLLGLPALVVITADNQRDDARILHQRGAIRNLGEASTVTAERWAQEISALKEDSAGLARMSRAALDVMSGRDEAMRELSAALWI